MTEITTQDWCDIANEVEPRPVGDLKWLARNGCAQPTAFEPDGDELTVVYDLITSSNRKLRLADYLAEKGVAAVYDGWDGHNKYVAMKLIVTRCGDTEIGEILASHNNPNMCRALAVLALIKEGK